MFVLQFIYCFIWQQFPLKPATDDNFSDLIKSRDNIVTWIYCTYCNALFSWITSTVHLLFAIYLKLCCEKLNSLRISLLFYLTSTGFLCPLISFIQFFCILLSHSMVLHLLLSLTFLHTFPLVHFDHLEVFSEISPVIYIAPKLWNSLALALQTTTLHKCKSKHKTYIFNQYYLS